MRGARSKSMMLTSCEQPLAFLFPNVTRDFPLPSSKDALLHSAELGRKVAALLDTEHGVAGVTEGKIEKLWRPLASFPRIAGGQFQTEEDETNRRIAAILLLEPSLNASYEAVKTSTYPWPSR